MKFTPPICKQLLIKGLMLLTSPFAENVQLSLFLSLCLILPDIFSFFVFADLIPYVVSAVDFLFVYVILIPTVLLSSRLCKYYKTLLWLIGLFLLSCNIYTISLYERSLNSLSVEIIAAILATNTSEVYEYFITYFKLDKLRNILCAIVLLILLFYKLNKVKMHLSLIPRIVLLICVSFSVFVVTTNMHKVRAVNIVKILCAERTPDLREYRSTPLIAKEGMMTDNIVMIIGESFSRSHSSMYGYEKNTNPLLGNVMQDSALFVYDRVTSSSTGTIANVIAIMSSYVSEFADSIDWYRCLNIIDIMGNAGFRNYWISNQSKRGVADNEIGRYAELCDVEWFVGDRYSGMARANLDEELFPYIDSCLYEQIEKKFIVIHLMGSHPAYKKRYPAKKSKFKAEDYSVSHSHLSASNRKTLSEYDNSVLYNDSIVYEIMRSFEGEDAVVIYFSDHGQDVFDSSDDYAGHAKIGNRKSECAGRDIPFMVYTSPLFREKHPELQLRIENAVDRPYRTDSVMYTIMDVAGIETVNGVSYKHKSLFK